MKVNFFEKYRLCWLFRWKYWCYCGGSDINIFYLGHEIMICEEPWIIFYFLISIAVIALMNPQSYNTTGLSTPMWGTLCTKFISVFWNDVCIHSFLHIIGRRLGIRFLHSFLQIVQKISRNSCSWHMTPPVAECALET